MQARTPWLPRGRAQRLTVAVSAPVPALRYHSAQINSLGGADGSGMDNLLSNRVVACQPVEACAAASVPSLFPWILSGK